MKLVIASDIHGSAFWCRKMLEVAEKEQPDHLILLGDILYHGPRNDLPRDYAPKQVIPMLCALQDKILCVRGNCEAEVDQMVCHRKPYLPPKFLLVVGFIASFAFVLQKASGISPCPYSSAYNSS